MKILNPYLLQTAKWFWMSAGKQNQWPCDIFGAVNLALPIDVVSLFELSLRRVEQWLRDRDVSFQVSVDDRSLHGFILVYRGSGFIFVNGTDSEDERRYTVAHEASHFILEYKLPRDKALEKLGQTILDVLDGHRNPTLDERVDGILASVNIQPFTHLLEKTGDGSFVNMEIMNAENDADALALELLAPSALVIKDVKGIQNKLSFHEFKDQCLDILKKKYLLPEAIATEYCTKLAYAATGGPSLVSKLGL